MGKRVFELAKELNVESKQVLLRMREAGIVVKDHLASLSKEDEDKARKLFETPRPGDVQVKKMEGGRVVRRRAGADAPPVPAPVAAPPPPIEEAPVAAPESDAGAAPEPATEPSPAPVEAVPAAATPGAETPAPAQAATKETKEAAPATPAAPGAAAVVRPAQAAPGQPGDLKALAEPDRKAKVRRLVYDRRRDVISIRDYMTGAEDETEHVETRTQPARRKKTVQRGRGRPLKTMLTLPKEQKRVIRIEGESIQVAELAHRMSVKANELVKKLMSMGVMASLTQSIDLDTAAIVASEFGFTLEKVGFDPGRVLQEAPDAELDLRPRPPVVTIMGHVDHGKTTLLDRIRKARVAEGEAGGITQHIGAYKVKTPTGGDIVFLDTPGHEAFTQMRARGAKATDIVVLVVAADDGVMAQTKEAIAHARDGGVPIIVAINKIDKPESNPDRVRRELSEEGIISEDWGGQNIFCEISAKQGLGIDNLMESILLQAEVLELKANPEKAARGVVLEAELDRQIGPAATILVQSGTLKPGDVCIAGLAQGRVRLLLDDAGRPIPFAGPATPVRVAGLGMVPNAGDIFAVLPDEKQAREVAEWQIEQMKKARAATAGSRVSLEDFFAMAQAGTTKELKVLVRADVQGSLAPIVDSIAKQKHPEISVKVIHSAVGNIAESDVNLAIASNAVIVGFNVSIDPKAQTLADFEKVDVKRYSVIYELLDDIRKAMEGLLAPKLVEKLIGKAEVRQVFNVSKVGRIAGCYVFHGHVVRSAEVRVMRGKEKVFEGKLSSLKRFKEDAREVKQGFECGMGVEGYEGIEVGDTLEFYEYESVRESIAPVTEGR
jgi:translation initiation factor IF-2